MKNHIPKKNNKWHVGVTQCNIQKVAACQSKLDGISTFRGSHFWVSSSMLSDKVTVDGYREVQLPATKTKIELDLPFDVMSAYQKVPDTMRKLLCFVQPGIWGGQETHEIRKAHEFHLIQVRKNRHPRRVRPAALASAFVEKSYSKKEQQMTCRGHPM